MCRESPEALGGPALLVPGPRETPAVHHASPFFLFQGPRGPDGPAGEQGSRGLKVPIPWPALAHASHAGSGIPEPRPVPSLASGRCGQRSLGEAESSRPLLWALEPQQGGGRKHQRERERAVNEREPEEAGARGSEGNSPGVPSPLEGPQEARLLLPRAGAKAPQLSGAAGDYSEPLLSPGLSFPPAQGRGGRCLHRFLRLPRRVCGSCIREGFSQAPSAPFTCSVSCRALQDLRADRASPGNRYVRPRPPAPPHPCFVLCASNDPKCVSRVRPVSEGTRACEASP